MRPLRERGNQGVSRNARPATNTGASPFARTFEARRSPRRPSWTPSASLSANRYRVAAKLERRTHRSTTSAVISGGGNGTGRGSHPPGEIFSGSRVHRVHGRLARGFAPLREL